MSPRYILMTALSMMILACNSQPQSATDKAQQGEAPRTQAIFEDVTAASGVDFQHFNDAAKGRFLFCEIVGAGGALFDYDNDGDLDLFLVQGQVIDRSGNSPALGVLDDPRYRDQLFRNDSELGADGNTRWRFTNVTNESRLVAGGYGMGAAGGDYDNDGFMDLYITNFGANQLWRNRGDGTFEDVTQAAGVGDVRWGTSAAWFDYDRDGYLDLYVANYVDFQIANKIPCRSEGGRPDYCGPASYEPLTDVLYRNRGDGTFEDVSYQSGISSFPGPGLGVVAADFNGDGWQDLYVANDQRPNALWMNRGDSTFENQALLAGAAVNTDGRPEASMGLVAGDFDSDGDYDLFMTHLRGETNTIYINNGGIFEDRSFAMGLGAPSFPYTGFGVGLLDFENDGDEDLVIANGEVFSIEALIEKGDTYPYDQINQAFLNRGDGRFADVTADLGPVFAFEAVTRGVLVGDLDNDGDRELVFTNNNGPARILNNLLKPGDAWIGFRTVRAGGVSDFLGAQVRITTDDGRSLVRRAATDGSYCAGNDPRAHFGLAQGSKVTTVSVTWPDGVTENFGALPLGRYHLLVQGASQEP